jgi:hypothetical protein
MKTSNKLLLILFLSMPALLGVIHLSLHSQLKQGHIINSMQSMDEWIRPYKGKAPAIVALEGNINVILFPSDSFFVEYQKNDAGHISCQPAGEDSLVIKGDGTISMNPHAAFQYYSDLPWVSVHTGRHTDIRLKGILALLKGGDKPDGIRLHIRATDTQLWIGESYGANGPDNPFYYDSVLVEAKNANLVLHRNAVVRYLSATMDDKSEVNDQHANIGSIDLQYTPLTKIGLTGVNLDKLKQSAH